MQIELKTLMDNFWIWLSRLEIIIDIKSFLCGGKHEKIKIVDMIVEKEKCLFVISSIVNTLSYVLLNPKGKNISLIVCLVQRMLLLLRDDLSADEMESLDDFLAYDHTGEKLDGLIEQTGFDREVLRNIINRLKYYQKSKKREIEQLREKLS